MEAAEKVARWLGSFASHVVNPGVVQGPPRGSTPAGGPTCRPPGREAGGVAAGGAGGGGLSTSHIGPRDSERRKADMCRLVRESGYVAVSGSVVQFAPEAPGDDDRVPGERVGGGLRGKIALFSQQSRRRMIRLLAQWPSRSQLMALGHGGVYALTLTYPAEFPTARASKKHLKRFFKRLKRAAPGCFGVWKLEPQKRGAPHFHLLVCGLGVEDDGKVDVRGWREWLSRTWYEVVASGDLRHLYAGTQLQKVRSERGAVGYASKYAAKVIAPEDAAGWVEPGRFWGVFGGDNMRAAMRAWVYKLPGRVWFALRRTMRKSGVTPAAVRKGRVARGEGRWWTFDRVDAGSIGGQMIMRLLAWCMGGAPEAAYAVEGGLR